MQLDPHFLFNALNTISSQVERDPKLTRRMIEHLGDLLRKSLESKNRQEVSLAEEMEFLAPYLAIQKIRFGEKLKIETQIEPEVQRCHRALALPPTAGRKCDSPRDFASRHGRDGDRLGAEGWRSVGDSRAGRRRGAAAGMDAGVFAGIGIVGDTREDRGLHPNGESSFAVRPRKNGGAEADLFLPLRLPGYYS